MSAHRARPVAWELPTEYGFGEPAQQHVPVASRRLDEAFRGLEFRRRARDALDEGVMRLREELDGRIRVRGGRYWRGCRGRRGSRGGPIRQRVGSAFCAGNADLLFEPRPFLERVPEPVLAMLGECDNTVPQFGSGVRFDEIFSRRTSLDYTVSVVPGMGYGLQADCGDTDRRGLQVRDYAPEYFASIAACSRQRGLNTR